MDKRHPTGRGTERAERGVEKTEKEGTAEALPVTSFQSLAAEGDTLAKQGEYRKAIEAYTKALALRPREKNALVARSRCWLKLGDPKVALEDAETILAEDPRFFKVGAVVACGCVGC
jgi:tetratricopeptide (TPR) repeat protein